jgi:nicotinamidase-related amidase
MQRALIIVDVQRGFGEPGWGPRDNPDCERHIARLLAGWRRRGEPVVFVRHDSPEPASPLAPGTAGNAFADIITGTPDLLVTKSVNSAFYGTPDLHAWLQERGIGAVTICGITANHCCETTARMAGNLGYDVDFVIDATAAFDGTTPDGTHLPAALVRQVTAANLHGEFATVVTTDEALAGSGG